MNVERQVDAWGRTIVSPDAVIELVLKGYDVSNLLVADDESIREYNEHCRRFDKGEAILATPTEPEITPEQEHAARTINWFISDDIQHIDVRQFLLSMCQTTEAWERVNEEMDLFEERNLIPLLQLMMYLVDHFRRNEIVWGVGRGSSVASYCLYLIGVHKIDPLRYGLDVHEFLK